MRTDWWTFTRRNDAPLTGGGADSSGPSRASRASRVSARPTGEGKSEEDDPSAYHASDTTPPSDSTLLHLRPDSIAFSDDRKSGRSSWRRPSGPPPPPPTSPPPDDEQPASEEPAADRRRGLTLPRRSLLAPEESEESKTPYASGDSPPPPRGRRNRPQRVRSRILSELRPVASPREAAAITVPAAAEPPSSLPSTPSEDGRSALPWTRADPEAPATPIAKRRAFDIFASERVRLQRAWRPDLWIYMYVDCVCLMVLSVL